VPSIGPPLGVDDRAPMDPPGGIFDGEPRRLHPSSPVLNLVLALRGLVFPLAFLVLGSGRAFLTGPIAVVALAALVGWRVLVWRRFSYRIDHDALRIEQGVFNRQRREVPLRRIQQVDLQRKLRHRVLGVAVVRIDTAGGGSGAEVVLEAIGDDDALALRSALLTSAGHADLTAADRSDVDPSGVGLGTDGRHDGDEPASDRAPHQPRSPAPAAAPEVLVELSPRQLVVAGVTGSRLAGILPLVGAGFGLFSELPGSIGDSLARNVGDRVPPGTVIPLLVVLALPLVAGLAAATSVLTDHGFTLVRIGHDLHLRRGLLDQREATLSLERIQVLRVLDNPVRRRLGLVSVQLQSAGSGSKTDGAVSRLTIPLVALADLGRLLGQVLPGSDPRPDLVPAPPAARRRAWVRRLVPVAVVVAALIAVSRSWWSLLALTMLVPAGFLAEQAFRGLGHAATSSFVFARRGGLFRETVAVPVAKAQSSRLHSSPFQRRAGLATLQLAVAGQGRTPAVVDGDVGRLRVLRHAALYAAAARADEEVVRRRTRAGAEDAAEGTWEPSGQPLPTGP